MMNDENVKKVKELVEVIEAFCKGKTIQLRQKGFSGWRDIVPTSNGRVPGWNINDIDYRVKPEVCHKMGNRYMIKGGEYLLASIGSMEKDLKDGAYYVLVHIKSGNRWSTPIWCESKNNLHISISEADFQKVVGYCEGGDDWELLPF